ncbi:MAG: PKD domain-containing protein [Myxococcales bacterium]|nr:PKD domain-containing protein [Myxococcales bacterium]
MRASLSLCLALVACPSGQVTTTEAETRAADGGTTAATPSTTASPPTTTAGNLPPVAKLADDLAADQAAPLQVKFTSLSSDPDGLLVATQWDFGDGEQAEGAEVTHVFVNEGSFAVTLTVTDDAGASAQAKVAIAPGGCPSFKPGAWQGDLAAPALSEASGLAPSRRAPGVVWTHNDSGEPVLFTHTLAGAPLGVYTLQGAELRDWEDMALGPGPKSGQDYLYVGDIGDNNEEYAAVTVYRVPEPPVDVAATGVKASLGGVEALVFTYPGGAAHNAETLLVDPVLGDLYIVGKAADGHSPVFRAAAPLQSGALAEVTALDFGPGGLTTGGSVSAAGDWVVVRTYFGARMWHRPSGAPLWQAFAGKFCTPPLAMEMQGEAIGFAGAGIDYFTTSEGVSPPLYHYVRG